MFVPTLHVNNWLAAMGQLLTAVTQVAPASGDPLAASVPLVHRYPADPVSGAVASLKPKDTPLAMLCKEAVVCVQVLDPTVQVRTVPDGTEHGDGALHVAPPRGRVYEMLPLEQEKLAEPVVGAMASVALNVAPSATVWAGAV